MQSKVDLHVHSKYSDRPSEWILRRIGAPESFVEPIDIYRTAQQRGMQFVTISDHNCIEGALEIAHLPGTFLSSEITTYFPEDGCKIHCLVSGVSEEEFHDIQQLRENIYDFQRYLRERQIVYSVAHPLFRVNDQLTIEHFEKLLLLFNRFEGINGTRDPRASDLVRLILSNLTPEMIAEMADRQGIEPWGDEPWKKRFTAGSDDHSGVYIASAYTATPRVDSVEQLLDQLHAGNHEMGGSSGTSLRLAHSFYHIAYGFYKSRLLGGSLARKNLIDDLFRRVLEGKATSQPLSFRDKLRYFARRVTSRARGVHASEEQLLDEISTLLARGDRAAAKVPGASDDRQSFEIACHVCHMLTYAFFRKFIKYAGEGRLVDSLQSVASLGPVALSMAPYLAAFRTQHKDERFLQAIAGHFEVSRDLTRKSDKKAWLTDTFTDVNGVSLMIRAIAGEAASQGRELTVITSLDQEPQTEARVYNFKPVGSFGLPEYDSQKVSFPPFLEVIEYLERERFGELIVSTPGPLGLAAVAAGRLLGVPLSGIYHTDFPLYVRTLTEDEALEQLTWRYMYWFYEQMETIYVPSEVYRQQLIDNGFDPKKLHVLTRGVDLRRFTPAKRDAGFWRTRGAGDGLKFVYVGRVSKEKNLDLLLEAFVELRREGADAELLVVGDGPYLEALVDHYRRADVIFTGFLEGETLAAAYASADVFVFPSTTDTFGNVVLEAQASGLPVIVSNRGGPAEIVADGESGMIFDAAEPGSLKRVMRRLLTNPDLRDRLAAGAVENASQSSWQHVLDDLWRPKRVAVASRVAKGRSPAAQSPAAHGPVAVANC
ncbi:MAG TPA: glycosyltransferase [Pirellulales bacterium]|nr:glycosyltransferase [Pirellulales bacterium]